MSELLTLKQAAAYVCRSPKTLRRICKARELPHIRLHGRILIEKQALDDFLKSLRVPVIDHTARLRERV